MQNRDREDLFGKQDRSKSEQEDTRRPSDQFEGSTGSISGEEDLEPTRREEEVEEGSSRRTMSGRETWVGH